jgi:hypothetical protein
LGIRVETGDFFNTMLGIVLTIAFVLLSFLGVDKGLVSGFKEWQLFDFLLFAGFGVDFL